MFPILPALILFLLQAHAGGDRAAMPLLDAWRIQAVTRGIDGETVRQVSEVLLSQLRKERIEVAPRQTIKERIQIPTQPEARPMAEVHAQVQRSRDGPNGF